MDNILYSNGSTEHCLFAPSAANRWLNCTASILFTKEIPDKTTRYAAEGQYAHEVAAMKLRGGEDINIFDPEVEKYVSGYVEYLIPYMASGFYGIESKFFISYIKGFGAVDFYSIIEDTIHIMDLKYGRVKVKAKDNTQLKLYSLGVIDFFSQVREFKKIYNYIYQPRIDNIDFDMYTPDELLSWANDVVSPKVEEALDKMKCQFKEGSWCYFCPGVMHCPCVKNKKAVKAFID